jgi:hypothetical protein
VRRGSWCEGQNGHSGEKFPEQLGRDAGTTEGQRVSGGVRRHRVTAMLTYTMSSNFQVGVILDRPLPPRPAHVAELKSRFDSVLVPDPGSSVVFFIQTQAESISHAVDQVISAIEEVMDARVTGIYASAGDGVPGQR